MFKQQKTEFPNNQFPDFSFYGYEIVNELGRNSQGGRITYKAQYIKTNHFVAIKRFAFHTTDWEGLKEIEREISVLKGLNHLGIPKYLDTFQHEGTVCLVQEYIDAPHLATNRSYRLEEIEAIALQCLEILAYIQGRTPPIIHRDFKPENILWNEKTKTAYLIDFGFARVHGDQSIAISSMALGTYGFMPPEALANKLNLSSDLYSLGVTLICLLCGISSSRIGNYLNDDCQIDAKRLLSNIKLSEDLAIWLQTLVSRKPSSRYQNAFLALQSFKATKATKSLAFSDISPTLNTLTIPSYKRIPQIEKKRKIKLSLTSKIIISTASITLLSFPWIAVRVDSLFSVAKQLQENYPSIQNKVNLEDCYQGIYSAAEAKTLEEAKTNLKRSSSCLNTVSYPIQLNAIESDLIKLFDLKKAQSLIEGHQSSRYAYSIDYQIIILFESLIHEANVIKKNLELLSGSRQAMNMKIVIYSYQIIGFFIGSVFFLIAIFYSFKERY